MSLVQFCITVLFAALVLLHFDIFLCNNVSPFILIYFYIITYYLSLCQYHSQLAFQLCPNMDITVWSWFVKYLLHEEELETRLKCVPTQSGELHDWVQIFNSNKSILISFCWYWYSSIFRVWTDTYTLTVLDVRCTIWWHWNNFVSEAERYSKQEVNSENQFSVSQSEAEWDSKQEVNSENQFSVSHSEAEWDSKQEVNSDNQFSVSHSEDEWYSKQEVNKCEPDVSKCACSEQSGWPKNGAGYVVSSTGQVVGNRIHVKPHSGWAYFN